MKDCVPIEVVLCPRTSLTAEQPLTPASRSPVRAHSKVIVLLESLREGQVTEIDHRSGKYWISRVEIKENTDCFVSRVCARPLLS